MLQHLPGFPSTGGSAIRRSSHGAYPMPEACLELKSRTPPTFFTAVGELFGSEILGPGPGIRELGTKNVRGLLIASGWMQLWGIVSGSMQFLSTLIDLRVKGHCCKARGSAQFVAGSINCESVRVFLEIGKCGLART